MSKDLLVVFGATGNQGGSIIRYVLDDPELSKRYALRGITRNASSPSAQALASKGVEVVAADAEDPSTLVSALKDAKFVFAVTSTSQEGNMREIETRQAKSICTEAIAQGAEYIIWSSMSHPSKLTNGAITKVEQFDVKAEIEQYIRTLPVKSAFFAPAGFMQNFFTIQAPRPSPANDGTWVFANPMKSDTSMPFLDITETGAWIAPVLADPDKYDGAFLAAAQDMYTMKECAETMSRVSGKTVTHVHLPEEEFKGYLPEVSREQYTAMYVFFRDYGYYGEKTRELTEGTRKMVTGKLSNMEEFLRREKFALE